MNGDECECECDNNQNETSSMSHTSPAVVEDDLDVHPNASLESISIVARLVAVSDPSSAQILISPTSCKSPNNRPDQAKYLVVGRHQDTVDIRVQHGSISRRHALLYYCKDNDHGDSKLMLQDLGGKYGTTVNSKRVHGRCLLNDNDTILFGNAKNCMFTVRIDSSAPVAAIHVSQPSVSLIESDQRQQESKTIALIEKASEGLSGRAKRQAEIAAMMATLEKAPSYEKSNHPVNEREEAHTTKELSATDKIYQTAHEYGIPVAQRFILESESERRNVTNCISVDPAGARFAVGSTDNNLRFYDFGGMDRLQSRPFKTMTPECGYWPVDCSFSNTGDRIIVGTGSVQPVVLDREGETVIKFVRGDMYVTDQSKTSGHTAAVTAVDWHPLERDIVLTASLDGSVRIWNLNGKTQFQMLVCDKVYQAKNAKGQRTAVTCAAFHPAGREFGLGTACGSIQVWSRTRASARPERVLFLAHGTGNPVSSLTYSLDGSKLATRSAGDDVVKVWSAQKISRSSVPTHVCTSASNDHDRANAAFSNDGKILVAGVSWSDKSGDLRHEVGQLNFYDISSAAESVAPLVSLDLDKGIGPNIVKWHPKICQIFVGCSTGQTIIYFDLMISRKGAISAAGKAGKKLDDLSLLLRSRAPTGSAAISGEIITPLYNEMGHNNKRKRGGGDDDDDDDTDKGDRMAREPERPATGKHKTGGQTAGGKKSFQQFVADKNMGANKEIAGRDPREALFKYKEGKSFVDRAYEGNKSKLAEKTAEQEEEESKPNRK